MPYRSNFVHADEVIGHLGSLRGPGMNPLLESKYIGFVAVACVTVFEMAIKEILVSFAEKKHLVLGNVVRSRCERMNGRIQIDAIKQDYIGPFGAKYQKKLDRKIVERVKFVMRSRRRDILVSYKNLILWRNDFAHSGATGGNATWAEVVQAYEDGKEIVDCLYHALLR